MMEIRLERVEISQQMTLFRLLQYSLFEESAGDGNRMGEDGLFKYPWFSLYFTEPEREAFFIRGEDGSLLGFVMVNQVLQKSTHGHSIAEFMVLPSFRRQGIGRQAALCCFEAHSGPWEVAPARGSETAHRFWRQVIDRYTHGNWREEDGILLFVSR